MPEADGTQGPSLERLLSDLVLTVPADALREFIRNVA